MVRGNEWARQVVCGRITRLPRSHPMEHCCCFTSAVAAEEHRGRGRESQRNSVETGCLRVVRIRATTAIVLLLWVYRPRCSRSCLPPRRSTFSRPQIPLGRGNRTRQRCPTPGTASVPTIQRHGCIRTAQFSLFSTAMVWSWSEVRPDRVGKRVSLASAG